MCRPTHFLLLCLLVAAFTAPAEAGLFDTVSDALKDAWGTVWTAVTGLAETVECKAVDWAAVSLTPCLSAPEDNLCTPQCKSNLQALSSVGQACIDRMLTDIAKAGNETVTDRWEEQLGACNITFTPPNAALANYGGILLPLVVVSASVALVELLRP